MRLNLLAIPFAFSQRKKTSFRNVLFPLDNEESVYASYGAAGKRVLVAPVAKQKKSRKSKK